MKFILSYILTFVFFGFFLPDSFRFPENWHTFYWNVEYLSETLNKEGVIRVLSDFLTQFLAYRWSASLLASLPCAVLSSAISHIICKYVEKKVVKYILTTSIALLIAAGSYFGIVSQQEYSGETGRFKNLMWSVRCSDWEKIISQSKGRVVNNLLEQNILNMALAEKGMLDEHLMDQPCRDILSIYVQEFESPYVAAMLSDIYWSMGHVAFSQTYAFQANEKLDNLSPRLLQRLTQTAIVFGQYELAERYLWWLDQTLFYKEWSKQHRALLNDEAVEKDPYYSVKRHCIIEEDRFSGSKGLDQDLSCIVAQNPDHKATAQFLNALVKLYYGK